LWGFKVEEWRVSIEFRVRKIDTNFFRKDILTVTTKDLELLPALSTKNGAIARNLLQNSEPLFLPPS
jgi:hypothetical protein